MKIQALQFRPRTLTPSPFKSAHEHALREENPLLIRGVDTANIGAKLLQHTSAGAGLTALVGAGALAWGVAKWRHGETALDRLEAVGSLALAAESGLSVFGALRHEEESLEKVALPLALVHSGAEVIVGGADIVRGRREHDGLRTAAGVALMAAGAGLAVAHFLPGAALPLHLGAAAGMVARQLFIARS